MSKQHDYGYPAKSLGGHFRYMKCPEVCAHTARSKAAIYAGAADGSFPRPYKIGARASAWRSDEVEAWKANPTGFRAPALAVS